MKKIPLADKQSVDILAEEISGISKQMKIMPASTGGFWCGTAVVDGDNYYLTTGLELAELEEGFKFSFFTTASSSNPLITIDDCTAYVVQEKFKGEGVKTVVFVDNRFFLNSGSAGEYGTAAAAQVLVGYNIGTDDGIVEGTMLNHGSPNLIPTAVSQPISAGYYSGGSVSAVANLNAANIKTGAIVGGVTGNFTSGSNATAAQILNNQTAYVNGTLITGSMADRGAPNFIPNTASQPITAGYYSGGSVSAVANLSAANIKTGVIVGGVTGNFSSGTNATAAQVLINQTAYVNGTLITGSMPNRGAPNFIPNATNQSITAGYYSGGTVNAVANLAAANIKTGVTVGGITGNFTSGTNATAAQILVNQTAYVNGTLITGSMANRGAPSFTPSSVAQTLSAGYYSGGTINAITPTNGYYRLKSFDFTLTTPYMMSGYTAKTNIESFNLATNIAGNPSFIFSPEPSIVSYGIVRGMVRVLKISNEIECMYPDANNNGVWLYGGNLGVEVTNASTGAIRFYSNNPSHMAWPWVLKRITGYVLY